MYKIERGITYDERNKWLCYLINPYITMDKYDYLIAQNGYIRIKGGSYEIVERKVIKQLKSWESTKDEDNARLIEIIAESKAYHEKLWEDNKNNDDLPF